jgi:ferrochelatase
MTCRPVGVLLLQLGTPAAPTAAALRTYLREFLSDRRVIDLPRTTWLPILHGIVLRTRPRRSAALYRKIWTPEGSPLAVISGAQVAALQQRLDPKGTDVQVRLAMRYGQPSIANALRSLVESGVERIVAVPMYPQYAGATTGSSLERLFSEAARLTIVPSVRVLPPYPGDEGYVHALATLIGQHVTPDAVDHLVLSFHGLPARYAREGDPYPEHCAETAARLTARLGWPADRVTVAFQSRFGREVWLEPYTDATLARLAREGKSRVAVMCPGFTADCLETLEEMAITNRHIYLDAGGREYTYIPCVNTSSSWMDALEHLVWRELSGWLHPAAVATRHHAAPAAVEA